MYSVPDLSISYRNITNYLCAIVGCDVAFMVFVVIGLNS